MERRIQVLEQAVPRFVRDLEKMFGPRDTNFEFGRIYPVRPYRELLIFTSPRKL